MKKIAFITILLVTFTSQSQLKNILKKTNKATTALSTDAISSGLKEALNNGNNKQVVKLTAKDGFFGNQLVKITLPEELAKVDKTLRKIGLGSMADEGILALNRAAEEAVKESTPIFVDAIKGMSITDAKSILTGNQDAATTYLQKSTSTALYSKFNPVIQKSLNDVGATKIWETLINKYNSIPLVTKVNPNLTDYTTNKALEGVFKMIAVEEKIIRTDLTSRSSDLLKKVFAIQDKK